jgi:GDP-D-mannose 3', 5'-epimerase
MYSCISFCIVNVIRSQNLGLAYNRNYGMRSRVARYHNIFGPEGTWDGGKEKARAAICRKIARARDGEEIEIWGDGLQTRSFLYIDECLDGTIRLLRSPDFEGPVNIGSDGFRDRRQESA